MTERPGRRNDYPVRHELDDFSLSPSIEIFPTPTIGERLLKLYSGRDVKVSITSSADQEIEDTLNLARLLASNGFKVVPHIAAREITDENHLNEISSQLLDLNIDELFLIRGEGEPIGRYRTSAQIINSLGNLGIRFNSIGIGGYPEGLEGMTDQGLNKAIATRKELAQRAGSRLHIVTQMCFDEEKIAHYIANIDETFGVPVTVGLPVTEQNSKLHEIATRCGVGDSKDVLLDRPDEEYSPLKFANKVLVASSERLPAGFHIYTFNRLIKARQLVTQI